MLVVGLSACDLNKTKDIKLAYACQGTTTHSGRNDENTALSVYATVTHLTDGPDTEVVINNGPSTNQEEKFNTRRDSIAEIKPNVISGYYNHKGLVYDRQYNFNLDRITNVITVNYYLVNTKTNNASWHDFVGNCQKVEL